MEETIREAQVTERLRQDLQMQLDFGIINTKLQLLNLAKELIKEGQVEDDVIGVYLDLREEVLGIPNPNSKPQV